MRSCTQRSRRLAALLAAAIVTPLGVAEAKPSEDDEATTSELTTLTTDKGYSVSGISQFRTLFINDIDPANDRNQIWILRAAVKAFPKGRVSVRMGLIQSFVDEPQESGLDFQDTQLNVGWSTKVPFGVRDLAIAPAATLYLPTSRASRRQDLIVATQGRARFSIDPIRERLEIGLTPRYRYRFHEFAERAGLGGGMNIQQDLGLRLDASLAAYEGPRLGTISLDLGLETNYFRKYESRDPHISPTSHRSLWLQDYAWDATVGYTPTRYVTLALGVEHGGTVLRNGIVNTFFAHRDETELTFTLSGTY